MISSTAKTMDSRRCKAPSSRMTSPQRTSMSNLCRDDTTPRLRSPSWLKWTLGRSGRGRIRPLLDGTGLKSNKEQKSHAGPRAGRCAISRTKSTTSEMSVAYFLNFCLLPFPLHPTKIEKRKDKQSTPHLSALKQRKEDTVLVCKCSHISVDISFFICRYTKHQKKICQSRSLKPLTRQEDARKPCSYLFLYKSF